MARPAARAVRYPPNVGLDRIPTSCRDVPLNVGKTTSPIWPSVVFRLPFLAHAYAHLLVGVKRLYYALSTNQQELKIRRQEELIVEEKAARERELREADLPQVPTSESQSEVDTETLVGKQTNKESSASSTFVNDETPDEVGHDEQDVDPDASEEYSEHGDEHLDEKQQSAFPSLSNSFHSDCWLHFIRPPPPAPKPIDYGPSEAFRMLSDLEDCLEFSDQQYTYRFCAFKEIFQRERGSSGQETSLGSWDDWAYADDDMGRENKYAVMLFKDGLGCWNGPARSTR
ncbi:uncharacterized protein DEA37_0014599, partial [Paragonimus westermani]